MVVSGNSADVLALSLKTILKLVLSLKFVSKLRLVRQVPIVKLQRLFGRGFAACCTDGRDTLEISDLLVITYIPRLPILIFAPVLGRPRPKDLNRLTSTVQGDS